jgi:phage tail sheath protein FI
MSKAYKSPEIYIEEPSNSASVKAVDMAIPAFIGYTQKAQQFEVGDLLFTPTRITSISEYEYLFGTLVHDALTVTIDDIVDVLPAGPVLAARKIAVKPDFLKNCMHYQLQLYFANGGGPCYIVSTGKPKSSLNKRELLKGLDEIYNHRETALIVFTDAWALQKTADIHAVYVEALRQAAELKDRFVIMDIPQTDQNTLPVIDFIDNNPTVHTQNLASYGAAYYPMLTTNIPYHYTDNRVKILHQVVRREAGKQDMLVRGDFDKQKLANLQTLDSAFFSEVKSIIQQHTHVLPPGAAVAGVYADVDRTRGIWKAPANTRLQMVKEPFIRLNQQEQAILQTGGSQGRSINAIRIFEGKGTVVWGARTLAGNDNEWRYISVRRYFMMVEKSTRASVQHFVFEANDAGTWSAVKQMIDQFLTTQWKAGALQGAKPEHAFYVHCGLGTSMTQLDITEGRMIIEIGMAVVRPAEFIILQIAVRMQTA